MCYFRTTETKKMKLLFTKILYLISLVGIIYYLTTSIYNSYTYDAALSLKVFFIVSVLFSIALPIVIFTISNNTKWLICTILMLVLISIAFINFKSDFLQKTIFSNQMVSTYKFQNTMEEFIKKNEFEIITEIKKIEAYYNSKKINKNTEVTEVLFVNNPGHLKDIDTLETYLSSNKETKKRRKIITKFYENFFDNKLNKNNSFQISNLTIKNNKVHSMHIYILKPFQIKYFYNDGVIFYPKGFTDTDKRKFSSFREFSSFGKNFYLQYCESRYYIYKNKWLFKVVGQCNG